MKKWLCVFIGAIISLGYVGSAEADKAFLKALQDTLAKLGNPWIAGETELSDLPIEEKRKMFGFLPMPEREWGSDLEEVRRPSSKNPPPASWDWRDKDGKNWMTPVKNQQLPPPGCGACWAFGIVSAMEARIKIIKNTPTKDPDLSEQFLLSCNTQGHNCNGGNYSAFIDVKRDGIPDDDCFLYVASKVPCSNSCDDWRDRAIKVTSYRTNYYIDVSDEQKKEWIMEGPIACAIAVKEDFFYYKGGIYEPILGEKADHGVCCLGWTSSGNWICKNSWGPNQAWPIMSKIEWPTWCKPAVVPDTGTPIIWTTDSFSFVFGQKQKGLCFLNPPPSISSVSEEVSSSFNLGSVLLEGEHILEPSLVGTPKSSKDTISYDTPTNTPSPLYRRTGDGTMYWGVRFTPLQECRVLAALHMTCTMTSREQKLSVRDDVSGKPGNAIEEITYDTEPGVMWSRQDLSTPYSDADDFWLTYYGQTSDQEPEAYVAFDEDGGGERSFLSVGGSTWMNIVDAGFSGDFAIRAIVTYEGGYAGSGIIWVENIGAGKLTVSDVHSDGGSSWIFSLGPTSFDTYPGDSAGIEVCIDTSGLQTDVLYTDVIVIISNSNNVTTENRVPISLFINSHGIAEEKESMLATFKLSPNPFRGKVGISYFVPEKANVKLVVCDIAGREVAKIVDRVENTGIKKIEWDTKDIPSGVYFCRLMTGNSETTKKILLVR